MKKVILYDTAKAGVCSKTQYFSHPVEGFHYNKSPLPEVPAVMRLE